MPIAKWFQSLRGKQRRRHASRRDFLRLERLEDRVVLSGASPTAVNDLYFAVVDQPLEISAPGILANDTDPEGDVLSAGLFSGPANGALEMNEDGSFRYTPNAGFIGLDSFVYFANDGTSDSKLAAVTIRVREGGTPPVAADDAYSVDEDGVLNVGASEGVLANDSDAEGDALTAQLVAGPANGTLSLSDDGSFTYIPSADFNGTDSFTYVAVDAAGESNVATVTITVNPVNDKPEAINDAYEVDEDHVLTVSAEEGVLANDFDIDGDVLTPVLESGPLNGTVVLNADGSFTYTPHENFHGLDGFSYYVTDGLADSDVATVTITVHSVNDAPVAVNDEYVTEEDTPLVIDAPGVLANDFDVDGDALTAILVNPPQHGTVTLNADGSLLYTPDPDFHGIDGFSYLVNDGAADSDVASVTITVTPVNDAPVAADDAYATDEDTPLVVDAAAGVLANDSDVDGDDLVAELVSGPAHGTLELNADGSFVYTPNADFHGEDSFTYSVSDGELSSEATVTITVNPVNDAPVAADDVYQMNEDTTLTIGAPGVLGNDSDPDGDPLTAILVSGTTNGTLTFNADGSFVYTPNADFFGTDSFTYVASDGTLESNEATVLIRICPVNDAPVAADDAYEVDEDAVLTVDAASGVLANDFDVDGDALTATLVSGPANGTLELNADGSFVYTPNANFFGIDTFVYAASDGTLSSEATVTITVNAVEDAPIAALDFYSTGEDIPLVVGAELGVLANDLDPQGLGLTAELVTGPANGTLVLNADGSFVYTPNENWHGEDSFTYMAVAGGEEVISSAHIIVEPLNDRPVAVDDVFTIVVGEGTEITEPMNVLANDFDVDGDSLIATLVQGPASGTLTLNADGSFNYVPNEGFSGEDSFRYQAFDGMANSNVATVTLLVGAPQQENTAPVGEDDAYAVQAGETLTVDAPGVLANDSDADGDALTAVLVNGPANGTLELNADGSFVYTPDAGFAGEDAFTYMASDGQAQSEETVVTITVSALGALPPVAVDDAFTMTAGTTLEIAAPGVLENDSAPEGEPLTATLVGGPAHGTLVLNADGSFVYTPDAGFVGIDTFSYTASDGTSASSEAIVTIAIEAVGNQKPAIVNDSYTVEAGATLEVSAELGLLANDSDPDGDALTASLFSGPLSGVLNLNADGSFSYTPNAGFTGIDSFLYRVFDGELFSALGAVTIRVTPASSSGPLPTPIPDPTDPADPLPEIDPCLAVNESGGDELLDSLLGDDADEDALDALFADGQWA